MKAGPVENALPARERHPGDMEVPGHLLEAEFRVEVDRGEVPGVDEEIGLLGSFSDPGQATGGQNPTDAQPAVAGANDDAAQVPALRAHVGRNLSLMANTAGAGIRNDLGIHGRDEQEPVVGLGQLSLDPRRMGRRVASLPLHHQRHDGGDVGGVGLPNQERGWRLALRAIGFVLGEEVGHGLMLGPRLAGCKPFPPTGRAPSPSPSPDTYSSPTMSYIHTLDFSGSRDVSMSYTSPGVLPMPRKTMILMVLCAMPFAILAWFLSRSFAVPIGKIGASFDVQGVYTVEVRPTYSALLRGFNYLPSVTWTQQGKRIFLRAQVTPTLNMSPGDPVIRATISGVPPGNYELIDSVSNAELGNLKIEH